MCPFMAEFLLLFRHPKKRSERIKKYAKDLERLWRDPSIKRYGHLSFRSLALLLSFPLLSLFHGVGKNGRRKDDEWPFSLSLSLSLSLLDADKKGRKRKHEPKEKREREREMCSGWEDETLSFSRARTHTLNLSLSLVVQFYTGETFVLSLSLSLYPESH